MATPNSSPASECWRATPASAGKGIAAPAVNRSPSRAVHRNDRPRRSTTPGNPRSDTSRFEPLPMTSRGTPSRSARPTAWRSSPDSASTYAAAGPPSRNEVNGARGKSNRTRSPSASRRMRRAASAAGPIDLPTGHVLSHQRQGLLGDHGDIPGPHRHHQVTHPDLPRQERRDVPPAGEADGPLPRSHPHQRVDPKLSRHTPDRQLSPAAHRGKDDHVRSGPAP